MSRLYEKFVLAYYQEHYSYLREKKASKIVWNLDLDTEESSIKFLPEMQIDITLRYGKKTLIIDTEYYLKTMGTYREKQSFHLNNLYSRVYFIFNE
ncbi:MAG: hypothetical protein J7L15_07880 [Clostridiales bacterium]|nr:hypothetical protein [Clostridiales bacterium]